MSTQIHVSLCTFSLGTDYDQLTDITRVDVTFALPGYVIPLFIPSAYYTSSACDVVAVPLEDESRFRNLLTAHFANLEPVCPELPLSVMEFITHQNARPVCDIQALLPARVFQTLRPFQRVAVQRAATWERAYIADEMGCGKTLEALATVACHRAHWPVLVVCPSSLRYNWAKEIQQWLEITNMYLPKTGKQLTQITNMHDYQFIIVSYGLLLRHQPPPCQTVIFDECHYTKSRVSKRALAATKVAGKARVVLMLSGTPFNYPAEMFQQLQILAPHVYPRFFHYGKPKPHYLYFADRYCKPQQVSFGTQRTEWQFKGYERSSELQAVLSRLMVRRRKRQVLSQLPAKARTLICLPPLKVKTEKAIQKLLTSDEKEAFMEAFRLTCTEKQPEVVKFMHGHVIPNILDVTDDKIIVFFHHQAMRETLAEALERKSITYFVIDGSTPAHVRAEHTHTFQTANTYRVALLSITAAGTGLTLTAANYVIFTETLFGPDLHLQAEDRAHRLGQEREVAIWYLECPNSTDEVCFRLIYHKEHKSSEILDQQPSRLGFQRTHTTELGTPQTNATASKSPQTNATAFERPEGSANTRPTHAPA